MNTQTYIVKILMIFAGVVLVLSGIIVFLAEPKITTKFLLNKIIFFITGFALIYLGAKWKGRNKNK